MNNIDFNSKGKIISLFDLPTDVLLAIFEYLDDKSLCRLGQTCHRLNDLASCDELWKKKAMKRVFTSSMYGLSLTTCPPFKEQCRLSKEWIKGHAKLKKIWLFEKNYMPWLQLDQDKENLYLAKGDSIHCLSIKSWLGSNSKKLPNHTSKGGPYKFMTVHKKVDICRFIVSETCIVTGGWQGKLSLFTNLGSTIHKNHSAHESNISDVGMVGNTIVSGSRDQTVKIWQLADDMGTITMQVVLSMNDKILSIAMNKYRRTFAVGTGSLNGVHPLQLKDLTSGSHIASLGSKYRNGAGVLDCHFQTPDTLMSAGYDTYVRLWDTRMSTSQCVRAWEEPHDNTVYCVTSDHRYGFVSGSCRHGVARLWDSRMRNSLQTFYLGGNVSSPVYTLQLTHTHLFAGLARGIFALDFR